MIKSEDIELNNVCVKVFNDDCLNVLREMPSNSVDAIVSDPPYGISFMAKKWDYDVPSVEVWKEAMRVLKPGGHALIACGTRTQHRMVVNIEDAGFEIRDVVSWIYGSGFPKSLNISKAIDKAAGAERTETVLRPIAQPDSDCWGIPNNNSSGENKNPSSYNAKTENVNAGKGMRSHTLPATDEAKQWDGWGTALKPACEFFTLCRKPLSESTVAKNVLKWGTGGINIDGCRVAPDQNYLSGSSNPEKKMNGDVYNWSNGIKDVRRPPNTQGRFPANLIHSGEQEVLDLFPESKSGTGAIRKTAKAMFGLGGDGQANVEYGDQGSAARFFYCPKASKKDRDEGLDAFDAIHRANGNKWTDQDYRVTSGERPPSAESGPRKNHHPTVKPTALMAYLCRLITPTGGVVLDPYMGSGSTGKAAVREGFSFVGIELDPDYYEICKARIIK